ncbi:MAG: YeeE/YedE family protein [Deltaproteobacteria bacterium]|nr:YeeE/YedE family protein [Deltaproteobacteria bacterium]
MFVFADLRMLLTFAGAVLIAAIGFVLTKKLGDPPRKPYHPGVILGGLIFGAGWAISGACPSIVMTQLGQGSMPALITLMGLLFGVWLHDKIKPKIFRFDGGSCEI